ncbi:hypothetical protein ACROYT_G014426 [Oculina patagonica]
MPYGLLDYDIRFLPKGSTQNLGMEEHDASWLDTMFVHFGHKWVCLHRGPSWQFEVNNTNETEEDPLPDVQYPAGQGAPALAALPIAQGIQLANELAAQVASGQVAQVVQQVVGQDKDNSIQFKKPRHKYLNKLWDKLNPQSWRNKVGDKLKEEMETILIGDSMTKSMERRLGLDFQGAAFLDDASRPDKVMQRTTQMWMQALLQGIPTRARLIASDARKLLLDLESDLEFLTAGAEVADDAYTKAIDGGKSDHIKMELAWTVVGFEEMLKKVRTFQPYLGSIESDVAS